MKGLFILALVLGLHGYAEAQKTCKLNADLKTQNCTVTISWTPGVGGTPATKYIVQHRVGTAAFADIVAVAAPSTSTGYTFTDAGNVKHDFVVLADGPPRSAPSSITSWTTPAIVPSGPLPPTNVIISLTSPTAVKLAWKNGCLDCDRQEVQFSQSRPNRNWYLTLPASTTEYTKGELRKNTTYTGRVRSGKDAEVSIYSHGASVTTPR
jgi:hypothetical protein